MKIVVFSDSHGQIDRYIDVLERERPQMFFHLGDRVGDAKRLAKLFPEIPMRCVCGNCDFGQGAPELQVVQTGGVTLFLSHGHTLGVKTGLTGLLRAAAERNAAVALYGHTHRGHCELREGIWVLNPGSLSSPRGCPASYGVIIINGGNAVPKVITYGGVHTL